MNRKQRSLAVTAVSLLLVASAFARIWLEHGWLEAVKTAIVLVAGITLLLHFLAWIERGKR